MVITKEGRNDPAIRSDAGTFFYDSYKAEMQVQMREATQLKASREATYGDDYSEENVYAVFLALGVRDQFFTSANMKQIASLAREKRNPFS